MVGLWRSAVLLTVLLAAALSFAESGSDANVINADAQMNAAYRSESEDYLDASKMQPADDPVGHKRLLKIKYHRTLNGLVKRRLLQKRDLTLIKDFIWYQLIKKDDVAVLIDLVIRGVLKKEDFRTMRKMTWNKDIKGEVAARVRYFIMKRLTAPIEGNRLSDRKLIEEVMEKLGSMKMPSMSTRRLLEKEFRIVLDLMRQRILEKQDIRKLRNLEYSKHFNEEDQKLLRIVQDLDRDRILEKEDTMLMHDLLQKKLLDEEELKTILDLMRQKLVHKQEIRSLSNMMYSKPLNEEHFRNVRDFIGNELLQRKRTRIPSNEINWGFDPELLRIVQDLDRDGILEKEDTMLMHDLLQKKLLDEEELKTILDLMRQKLVRKQEIRRLRNMMYRKPLNEEYSRNVLKFMVSKLLQREKTWIPSNGKHWRLIPLIPTFGNH